MGNLTDAAPIPAPSPDPMTITDGTVYTKTGLRSRAGASLYALERGLL
jgi:hypothetical protein